MSEKDTGNAGLSPEEWKAAWEKIQQSSGAQAHVCPNCGYCPHCGRGYRTQPYWHYQPWWTQPWYSHTGVWAVPCSGTISAGTAQQTGSTTNWDGNNVTWTLTSS